MKYLFLSITKFLIFYRYKKLKLQSSLLGLRVLLILFLNQLLTKQGKYSYKYFVIVFLENLERKK